MTWPAALFRVLTLIAVIALGGCLPRPQSQSEEEREPHFLAGKTRVTAMDYGGAVECFEKALELNPHSAAAHFELGLLFDQKVSDPAAAIYHYQKYLSLRQNADNADTVKTRILACKQALVATVSFGPVTQTLEKEVTRVSEENKLLRAETEQLRAALTNMMMAAQASAPAAPAPGPTPVLRLVNPNFIPVTSNVVATGTLSGASPRTSATAKPARIHTIQPGETATAIARKYGVKVEALLRVNPQIEPKRMRPGQTMTIPQS